MYKFVLTFIVVLMASNVFAYEQTEDFKSGLYWEKFPLKVRIVDPDGEESARLNGLLENSFNEWEQHVDQDIWELTDETFVKNIVRWSSDIEGETGYTAESTLGVAIRYSGGKYFQSFEIILNRNNKDLFNNVDNLLYNTIIHELGHSIGLGHSTEQSIMTEIVPSDDMLPQLIENADTPTESVLITRLSIDDIEGMYETVQDTLHRQEVGLTSAPVNNCAATKANAGSTSGRFSYLFSLLIGAILATIPRLFVRRAISS